MSTLSERLWSKIDTSDGLWACWPFEGAKNRGYGIIWGNDEHHSLKAHRVAYEDLVGPIPEDLTVDHLCFNRACCNPAHMELVTAGENSKRAVMAPWAVKARATHCQRGHEFTAENTATHNGRRSCRACDAMRARERRRTGKPAAPARRGIEGR